MLKSVTSLRRSRGAPGTFGGIFDVPKRQENIAALEDKMAQEGFWDNQEAANKIVTEASHLKSSIQPIIKFNGKVEDIQTLVELVEASDEAEAEEFLAEIRDGLAELAGQIEELEIQSPQRQDGP
jgi:peptide chain release factor 2